MASLALRNLFHDKIRLSVTVTGIVFAVVLIVIQFGLFVGFTQWKRTDGSQESIEIIGFELESGLGAPWNVVAGSIRDLQLPDSVIIDEAYRDKLGVTRIGDTVEINDHRARVVGFTRDIRS